MSTAGGAEGTSMYAARFITMIVFACLTPAALLSVISAKMGDDFLRKGHRRSEGIKVICIGYMTTLILDICWSSNSDVIISRIITGHEPYPYAIPAEKVHG